MKEPQKGKAKSENVSPEEKLLDLTKQCERSLLGCMILNSHAISSATPMVTKEDFANPYYGQLYDLMLNLHESGQHIDVKTLVAEVKKQNLIEMFPPSEIGKLAVDSPHYDNAEYYAGEVARLSGNRRVALAAKRLLEQEFDLHCDPEKLVSAFDARVQGALRGDAQAAIKHITKAMRSVALNHEEARREARTPGFTSGYRDIDQLCGGWHSKQLVLLGGRPFMGKTALAIAFAIQQLLRQKSTLFFSLEMTAEEIASRAASAMGGIPFRRFTQGSIDESDIQQIHRDADAFAESKFFISDKADETVRSMEAKAKLHKSAHGLDFVIIDNVQLIEPENERDERHRQLTKITRGLKKLAKKLDVCVMVLSQLNDRAEGNEPDDSCWAECRQLHRDADTTIFMHRETSSSPITMLKFGKNRNGKAGKVFLSFDGAIQWFRDCDETNL